MTAPAEGGIEKDNNSEQFTDDVAIIDPAIQIFDLYSVGYNPNHAAQPFTHHLDIDTGIGGLVRVQANFDDGALTNAMSTTKFNTIKHRLGYYMPSPRLLRMADGNIVKPIAVWKGKMEIEGVKVFGSFEVFDSGGNWDFLLGKPLLTSFHAIHEYTSDTISISNNGTSALLKSQYKSLPKETKEVNEICPRKPETREDQMGSIETLPPKEVQVDSRNIEHTTDTVPVEETEPDNTATSDTRNLQTDDPTSSTEIDISILEDKLEGNVFTRHTDPFKKERVEEILRQIKVGPDLNDEERHHV